MWLVTALSVCVVLTAAAAGTAIELSDLGSTTGDEESPREGSAGMSLEQLDLRAHHIHHKCKEHKSNKMKPHEKAAVSGKTGRGINGNALGPISKNPGAVRDFEDLSRISSLSPNFWVRTNLPNRTADPELKKGSDCFYKSRTKMRHYPSIPGHACYFRDFVPRMTAWWNFWPEIRGDLQYAFDFVMWDEYEQYHETNSFWYLMLYLKTLVTRVSYPNDIAPRDLSALRPRPNKPLNKAIPLSIQQSPDSIPDFEFTMPFTTTPVPYLEDFNQLGGGPDQNIPELYLSGAASANCNFTLLFELIKEYQNKLDHLEYLLKESHPPTT